MPQNTPRIPAQLREFIDLPNIVPKLSKERLVDIGDKVVTSTQRDDDSRSEWKKQYEEAMKIAKQVVEEKNSPWPGASNIKYPLITSACIQYNARLLPEIIQGEEVVRITNLDPETPPPAPLLAGAPSAAMPPAINAGIPEAMSSPAGPTPAPVGGQMPPQAPPIPPAILSAIQEQQSIQEEAREDRLGSHMSYQLLEEIDNWRPDTDRLLMILPLIGVVYRKSYFDSIDKKPQIDLCLPEDIVVHNDIPSLERAQRVTHIVTLSRNELIERMRAGIYEEYSLDELESGASESGIGEFANQQVSSDEDEELYEVLEQHTFLDLDDDDYEEPYIVVVHAKSRKVLRIVARYDEESFVFGDNSDRFIKITPQQYFTDYHFMPAPDGKFHSMGFGTFLYPLNDTINTLLNQLVDAGTLANRGGGFVARRLRARKEDLRFKIGEYKSINVPSGSTLAENIYPMPVHNAPQALFQLLEMLVGAAKELASITDVMQGKAPISNTPASTVIAMVEQGEKIYSAMLHRIYHSFKKEFDKLYKINKKYLSVEESFVSGGVKGMVSLQDYQNTNDAVFPVADPYMGSAAHRLIRAQALLQLMPDPNINKYEVMKRYLIALKIPDIDSILEKPDPHAPPPIPELQAEAELKLTNMKSADLLMKRELEALGLHIRDKEAQAQAAYWGGQVTANKMDSIADLARAEAEVGAQHIANVEQQAAALSSADQTQFPQQTEQRIQQLEGIVSQLIQRQEAIAQPGMMAGMPPSGAQPQQAQPEGTGPDLNLPPEIAAKLQKMSQIVSGSQGGIAPPEAEGVPSSTLPSGE